MKTGLSFLVGLIVLVAAPNASAARIDGSLFDSRQLMLDNAHIVRAEQEEPFGLLFDLESINKAPAAARLSLDGLLARSIARSAGNSHQDRITRFSEPERDFEFEFLAVSLVQTPLPAAAPIMLLGLAGVMTLARRRS